MTPLDSLAPGRTGTLACFSDTLGEAAEQRLRELGLDEGLAVQVVRRLPLGGPVIVGFGRVEVAIRPAEARLILLLE